ncbi:MAG: hypothetical protein H6558_09895 [Lewinellaceae bacterium]|nr:hypothetical protein [Lewinellaceae bacterium]MCB9287011.1 hypothetical protein [Lewinellaceae bacterium]
MKSQLVSPGQFEPVDHWYAKALNATIHPMISFFLFLSEDRIIKRYCHLHPTVKPEMLRSLLTYKPKYFIWAGADLMHVTNEEGKREMVVIENNSCPSGQKSMPLLDDNQEQGGYRLLMERTVKPLIKSKKRTLSGGLAVVYDKNPMEALGYARAMADVFNEDVHYVAYYQGDEDPPVRFEDGIMFVRSEQGEWHQIRAAFRYLTQRPWTRLPIHTKTLILNPIVACLAGGRNKMLASKAYDIFNAELEGSGLEILTPETIWDVSLEEVPIWVRKLGGQAVVKIPYSNAGQGVFTIVNQEELDAFMQAEFHYKRFIVQSLIGNYNWSSTSSRGRLYHIGTVPSSKGNTYVADLRMMVSATPQGIRPISIYARRAAKPLADHIEAGANSWDMLGTNLSIKEGDNNWGSDTTRLMLMDRRDFNKLGLGLDDLVDAYIQTVLSMIAIDKMAATLFNTKNKFRTRLFRSLDDDRALIDEIML